VSLHYIRIPPTAKANIDDEGINEDKLVGSNHISIAFLYRGWSFGGHRNILLASSGVEK
jgi:hypothetical protein